MHNVVVGISMLGLGALIAMGALGDDENVLPWFFFPLGAAVLIGLALRASKYDRYSYLLAALGLFVSIATDQQLVRGLTWAACGALLLALSMGHRTPSLSAKPRRVPVWFLWLIGIVVVTLILFYGV